MKPEQMDAPHAHGTLSESSNLKQRPRDTTHTIVMEKNTHTSKSRTAEKQSNIIKHFSQLRSSSAANVQVVAVCWKVRQNAVGHLRKLVVIREFFVRLFG
jgi:hypothetical protein